MANALFAKGRQGFLDGSIDWDTDDIRCAIIDHADDTPVIATDTFLGDIASAAIVARTAALTGKTVTDGVADAADVTFSAVTGDPCESLVIYKYNASDAAARLIAYIDTTSAGAFTVTPNGGDITIVWDNGANRIFKL
jgi:hypothetical protein